MTLSNLAYEKVRELLAAGRFPPGCHLVNQELSRRIGIGLTPVREAIARLASEGLLQHTPGAGVFVRRPSSGEVLQLCDLRCVLEPYAVQLAAEHRSEGDLREMRSLLGEEFGVIRLMAQGPGGKAPRELARHWCLIEQQFHSLMLQAAGNPWLAKAAADVSLLAIIFSPERLDPGWLTVPGMVASWRDHRRLVRLVERRAGSEAAELMRRHLAAGRKKLERVIGSRQTTGWPHQSRETDALPSSGLQPFTRRRGRPPGTAKGRPTDEATSV